MTRQTGKLYFLNSDHRLDVLCYAMSALLVDGHDHPKTGIASDKDPGLTNSYYEDELCIQVYCGIPGIDLRLTIFDGGYSIRVDRDAFDTDRMQTGGGRFAIERYCSLLNAQQSFFEASLTKNGIIVSAVLHRDSPVTKGDVDDLLSWTAGAASFATSGFHGIESGDSTPAEAAVETCTEFAHDIPRSFPHLPDTEMPHTPFPREE